LSKLLPLEDPIKTIQKSFEDCAYPVQLAPHPEKGRHLITPRLIEPGETLLECQPYAAVILDTTAQTHCHCCYQRLSTTSPPIRCECNFALYCSEKCVTRDANQHSEECQLLRENALEKNSWAVRLLVRCLTRRIQEGEFDQGLWWLQQRSGGLLPEQMQWWDPILRTLAERYKIATGLDQRGLTHLLSIIQNNSITITQLDADKSYDMVSCAAGIYIHASFFNHSCAPNCTFWFTGSQLAARATERILPGFEVNASYVHTLQLYLPQKSRRQRLLRGYGFECYCHRCAHSPSDPMEHLFEAVLCSKEGCNGRVATKMSTSIGRCSMCGAEYNIRQEGGKAKKERERLQALLTLSNGDINEEVWSQVARILNHVCKESGLHLHYLHLYDFHLAWDVLCTLGGKHPKCTEKEMHVGIQCCERVRRCVNACLAAYHPEMLRILYLESEWTRCLAEVVLQRDVVTARSLLERSNKCKERLRKHLEIHEGTGVSGVTLAHIHPRLTPNGSGELSRLCSISPGTRFSPKPLVIDSCPQKLGE